MCAIGIYIRISPEQYVKTEAAHTVVVMVGVVLRPDIFHLKDVAAFGATFDWSVAGHL